MNRIFTSIIAATCLMAASVTEVTAQEYTTPQVVVSKEKIRYGGKVYYSHIVQERQTLYSISKAYNVTLQEIYDSNPTLNLESEGLKNNQILLIPLHSGAQTSATETAPASSSTSSSASTAKAKGGQSVTESEQAKEAKADARKDSAQEKDYFFHRVTWFEDLDDIADEFKVSKKSIMNINALTTEKVKRRQMLKIPYHPEEWENRTDLAKSEDEALSSSEEESPEIQLENQPDTGVLEDLFSRDLNHKVDMSLLLPFNAKGKPNELIMDFYCGALMAARDLGENGENLNLNVFDIASGVVPESNETFAESDFTIGPVSNADILKAFKVCRSSGWIVSPLDPKAEELVDTIPNLIQAPTPTGVQVQDMLEWIKAESKHGDKVILITQKGTSGSSYATSVINAVNKSGLSHSTLSFSVLEGRNILGTLSGMMSEKGTTRIIMASDSEAFAIEVVRNLYMLSNKGLDLALYSTSKIRTFDTIDLQQLHNINLHVCLSYYVDYDSEDVRRFLLEYRALFNAEPTQFAFQGYDLMKCFSTISSRYGKRWEKGIDRFTYSGMQADFNFLKAENGGYVNNAVRRIVYKPDYSIEKVR